MINQLPICDFGQDVILCSQPIDMNLHLLKNVKSPVNKFDAVSKAYADRIKYKTASGHIPNTVLTDHILFIFPIAKPFASGKIKYARCGSNGWKMSGWPHQVQCSQLSGQAFTSLQEVSSL